MRKISFKLIIIIAFMSFASITCADITSSVWTTGVSNPNDGAFGTPGSVVSNSIDATITTGTTSTAVKLAASNGGFLRTSGSPNVTNNELAPFFENDATLTNLSFTSDIPLHDFDLLIHNVWNQGGTNGSGSQRINYVGNFEVTYENGTVVTNALPSIRSINNNSPFSTDLFGGTLQPTDLNGSFDGGNLLQATSSGFDPGNGAGPGQYFFDPSESIMSESQGFGILSFDESNGGITGIDFTWVGHTEGINTAFFGFAGNAIETSTVPEPSAAILILCGALCLLRRRRA